MSHLESLPARLHLDAALLNGLLTVAGTGSGDRVSIGLANANTEIHVTIGPIELTQPRQTQVFAAADVLAISVSGGDGEDFMGVGPGLPAVTMDGGGGPDVLTGGENDDVLLGGPGRDILLGLGGNDFLRGGAGADRLSGEGTLGAEVGRTGQSGNDTLYGDGGNDTLEGDTFNGTLPPGGGKDRLHGNAGNDDLGGGELRDYLFGDDGRDTLRGGSGSDRLDGGADNDKIYSAGDPTVSDTVFGGSGSRDRVVLPDENDVLSGIEVIAN